MRLQSGFVVADKALPERCNEHGSALLQVTLDSFAFESDNGSTRMQHDDNSRSYPRL